MDARDLDGPVFPVPNAADWQAHGISQRALFAAILMHSELTTCGLPGEACDALIEASRESGREPEDQMAHNAVQCADALLRALAEPAPYVPPSIPLDYVAGVWPSADAALLALKAWPSYSQLPHPVRQLVDFAAGRVQNDIDGIPF